MAKRAALAKQRSEAAEVVFRTARAHATSYRVFTEVYNRVVVPTQTFDGEPAAPLARLGETADALRAALVDSGHAKLIDVFHGLKTIEQLGLLAELLETLDGGAG